MQLHTSDCFLSRAGSRTQHDRRQPEAAAAQTAETHACCVHRRESEILATRDNNSLSPQHHHNNHLTVPRPHTHNTHTLTLARPHEHTNDCHPPHHRAFLYSNTKEGWCRRRRHRRRSRARVPPKREELGDRKRDGKAKARVAFDDINQSLITAPLIAAAAQ